MPKTLTVRLDDVTYRLLADAAAAENRSVSDFLETAARQRAMMRMSVGKVEMTEIRSDKLLRSRLKAGHAEAAARRGRFV